VNGGLKGGSLIRSRRVWFVVEGAFMREKERKKVEWKALTRARDVSHTTHKAIKKTGCRVTG